MKHIIVGFGDSNTRYWLGDMGEPGPLCDAWPAQLQQLLEACRFETEVQNEGYPGEQADFALSEFECLAEGADLCILNFGTNDVKKLEVPLEQYISQMAGTLEKAQSLQIPVVMLGIPWFDEQLGGVQAQERLPAWNLALKELCQKKGVPFVELYAPSQEAPEIWFNERFTPRRHLSATAQRRVAELVLPWVLQCLSPNYRSYYPEEGKK